MAKFYSIGVLKPSREMRRKERGRKAAPSILLQRQSHLPVRWRVWCWQCRSLTTPTRATTATTVASPDCDYRRQFRLRQPPLTAVLKHSTSWSNIQWRIHLRTSLMQFVLDDFLTRKEQAFLYFWKIIILIGFLLDRIGFFDPHEVPDC